MMTIRGDNKSQDNSVKDGAAIVGCNARRCFVPHKASINFWIDALAFLCLLVTAVSGMALMHIHPGENEGMTWGISGFIWLPLLNLIGWIFVASVVFHLAVRRGFVALMLSARLCSNRGAAAREGPIGINNL
jgi:hypothetical protein